MQIVKKRLSDHCFKISTVFVELYCRDSVFYIRHVQVTTLDVFEKRRACCDRVEYYYIKQVCLEGLQNFRCLGIYYIAVTTHNQAFCMKPKGFCKTVAFNRARLTDQNSICLWFCNTRWCVIVVTYYSTFEVIVVDYKEYCDQMHQNVSALGRWRHWHTTKRRNKNSVPTAASY